MPELIADFIRNGGTYMVLTDKSGLRSEQINRIQHAMLSSVNVPNLLRVDVREVDFNVSLYYEITGKRMLSQCLRHERIGMEEFYSLLLQIVSVLDESKQYMLSAEHFMLGADWIFVEDALSSGMLYFTYVPIQDKLSVEPPPKILISLITGLMGSVRAIEGDGIQQLLRYCSDDLFSVSAIKNLLLNLMSGDRTSGEAPQKESGASAGLYGLKNEPDVPLIKPPSSPRFTIKEYVPRQEPILEPGRGDLYDFKEKLTTESATESDEQMTSRSSMYVLPAALLLIGLAWKFIYLDHPSRMTLYVSLSATVLAVVVILVIRSRKIDFIRNLLRSAGSSDSTDTTGDEEGRFPESDWRWSELSSLKPVHKENWNGEKQTENSILESYGREEALPNVMPVAASVGHSPPPTVLLDRNHASGKLNASVNTYCLKKTNPEQGQPETIPLHFGSFVIGRSEDIAQYVDRTTGVSRAHAELTVRREGCSLKDLGSVNGTRLQGELIAPYKEYPLELEESFIIAGSTYTLKMSG